MPRLVPFQAAAVLIVGTVASAGVPQQRASAVPERAEAAALPTRREVPTQYPTIQAAVAAAVPGDTVFVRNGTYAGGVTLRSGVAIVGESRDGVVVQGRRADGEPYIGFDFYDYNGISRGLAGASVENLTIRGFLRGVRFADNLTAPAPRPRGITLRNLLVDDCGEAFYLSWNATPSGALVEGNEIRTNPTFSGSGVSLTRAGTAVRVTGNRITGSGIAITSDTYSSPVIDHNLIVGATQRGIDAGSGSATITNNTVAGSLVGLSLAFEGGVVSGNILAGNGRAVSIYSYAGTFRHNVYWNNTETGRALSPTETVGDPRFVAGGSYRLGPGSAAIDAGDPEAPFALEPAYNGRRADAGAFGGTPLATPSTPEVDLAVRPVPAAGVGAFAGADLVLTNAGTTRLDLRSVRVDGAAFALAGSVPNALAPGASDTLRVALVAQAQGVYSATVTVETNDEDEPVLTVPVTARRVERLYVDAAAPGGDGATWPTATADLTAALGFADGIAGAVEVRVRGGTYRPTGDGRRATFVLREGVALLGGFSGTGDTRDPALYRTTLSGDLGAPGAPGDNAYAVVTLRATAAADSAAVDGVTVTGGVNDDDEAAGPRGGGITGVGAVLVVRHATVASNAGVEGGGVACDLCTVTVADVAFRDNRAQVGGGLNVSRGAARVERAVFERNVSRGAGGGAAFSSTAYTLLDSRFSENGVVDPGLVTVGGGLYAQRGTGRIARVTFERNRARSGGGALLREAGATLLEDVVFDGNEAQAGGGGLEIGGTGDVRLARARFSGNTAGNGGGLLVGGFDPGVMAVTLRGATFEDNVAVVDGGAARLSNGTVVVAGARIARNRAPAGGGLSVFSSGLYLADAEFLANAAEGTGQGYGGALLTFGGADVQAVNTTFVGNGAAQAGSVLMALAGRSRLAGVTLAANGPRAFSAQAGAAEPATVEAANAIAWPVAAPFFAPFNPGTPGDGGTLAVDHALVQGGAPGTAVIDADPRYLRAPSPGPDGAWGTADDDYGDLRLQTGSPAIDAGLASLLLRDVADLDGNGDTFEFVPVDIRGTARVLGDEVDLGAYESDGTVAAEDGPAPRRGLVVSGANPARTRTALSFYTDAPSDRVVIGLYDVLGRRLAVLHDAPAGQGRLDVAVDASALAAGAYLVRAESAAGAWSVRLTVVR